MSSLEPSRGPLRAEHDRILRSLRRGADAPIAHAPEAIAIEALDPRAVEASRRVWSRRMIHEHASSAVFARLVPQLMECGASLEHCTSALRMAQDELHHGALCADVVRALGGEPRLPPTVTTAPLPEHAGCGPLERALRNVLFVGCLAETVAVASTAEEREQTREPYVLRVITQISADEVLHARFGWSFVKEAAPALDADARARTSRWLRVAFRYLEREEMLEVPSLAPPPEALREEGLRIGVCDNLATRELFYETIREVIVPGLEAAGLAAADAWAHRHAA
jgi:hypothetical protein